MSLLYHYLWYKNVSTNLFQKRSILLYLENPILYAASFSMCALSIDRYQAIVNPIKYRQNMSMGRCIKYTVSIWLLAIFSSLPYFIYNKIVNLIWMNFSLIFFAVVLLVVYLRVKKALGSHYTEFEGRMKESLTSSQETIKNRLKTEQKITRVYVIVLITVLVTGIPALIMLDIVELHNGDCLFGFVVKNVRLLLFSMNSVINPLVCMVMLRDFKESIKMMFYCRT